MAIQILDQRHRSEGLVKTGMLLPLSPQQQQLLTTDHHLHDQLTPRDSRPHSLRFSPSLPLSQPLSLIPHSFLRQTLVGLFPFGLDFLLDPFQGGFEFPPEGLGLGGQGRTCWEVLRAREMTSKGTWSTGLIILSRLLK